MSEYKPAFPQPDAGHLGFMDSRGMSLKDWFAGMALQGMLSAKPGVS